MAEFKIGQSVRLKGQKGSPIMTVSTTFGGATILQVTWWKTDTQCFKLEGFQIDCLELVSETELKEIMEKVSKV